MIARWIPSIITHLWYVIKNIASTSGPVTRKRKGQLEALKRSADESETDSETGSKVVVTKKTRKGKALTKKSD